MFSAEGSAPCWMSTSAAWTSLNQHARWRSVFPLASDCGSAAGCERGEAGLGEGRKS